VKDAPSHNHSTSRRPLAVSQRGGLHALNGITAWRVGGPVPAYIGIDEGNWAGLTSTRILRIDMSSGTGRRGRLIRGRGYGAGSQRAVLQCDGGRAWSGAVQRGVEMLADRGSRPNRRAGPYADGGAAAGWTACCVRHARSPNHARRATQSGAPGGDHRRAAALTGLSCHSGKLPGHHCPGRSTT